MMPKFRVWNPEFKQLAEVMSLDFRNERVFAKDLLDESVLAFVVMWEFDKVVVMQSTGLVDKNGKEIFEGDILSIETDEENVKVEVSWDSKHALFVFESKKYNEKEALGELFEDNSYPFKIIGNRYEHPELAEVKK